MNDTQQDVTGNGSKPNEILAAWNKLEPQAAALEALPCCGSRTWAWMLANARPFAAIAELQAASDKLWLQLQRTDWDEAFASHPPIGVTKTAPGATSQSARWSSEEQGGMPGVDAEVVQRLAEHNALYEQRFGRTFIVCATGKTAEQMLAILQLRLDSSEEQELREAVEQQRQITQLRLMKWLQP